MACNRSSVQVRYPPPSKTQWNQAFHWVFSFLQAHEEFRHVEWRSLHRVVWSLSALQVSLSPSFLHSIAAESRLLPHFSIAIKLPLIVAKPPTLLARTITHAMALQGGRLCGVPTSSPFGLPAAVVRKGLLFPKHG